MKITLKQILDEFKEFVNEHYQLYSYSFGAPDTISELENPGGLIHISPAISYGNGNSLDLALDIYVLFQEKQDKTNLETIMSETLNIANDIIALFKQQKFDNYEYDLWTVDETRTRLEPINFEFDNVMAGWIANITINIQNDLNKCEIPKD